MQPLSESTFDKEIKSGITVVDFHADWCAPCKMQKPILEKFAKANESVKIFTVDVEENQNLASRFAITSIPAILWFKEGVLVRRDVGLQNETRLTDSLKAV
jgi:thioredoxin 1